MALRGHLQTCIPENMLGLYTVPEGWGVAHAPASTRFKK